MFSFEVDIVCEFKGVSYRVVQVLDNGLYLAVKKEEYEEGAFPLQTYVIPEKQ